MRPFHAPDILDAWELGESRLPFERALLLLSLGVPEQPVDELATLPVGERDRLLWALRERTFGTEAACLAECPQCGTRLQFSVSAAGLGIDTAPPASAPPVLEAESGEVSLCFRLPTTEDLALAARAPSSAEARRGLLESCLLSAASPAGTLERGAVPADAWLALERAMEQADSLGEVSFELACPACGNGWKMPFDIGTFFWKEIAANARRLIGEVHELASRYGWSEAEILALSPRRRQLYLEMGSS